MAKEKSVGAIIVTPENLDEAKPGFIVAKSRKGQLVLVDPSYITQDYDKKIDQALEAVNRFDAFTRHVKHFKILSKSHFVNAFLVFKTRAMTGDIEVEDESLMRADEEVLSGSKKVVDALNENPVLRQIFVSIYGDYSDEARQPSDGGDLLTFPEV